MAKINRKQIINLLEIQQIRMTGFRDQYADARKRYEGSSDERMQCVATGKQVAFQTCIEIFDELISEIKGQ